MIDVYFVAGPDGGWLEVDSEVIARLPPQITAPTPAQSAHIFETWVNRGARSLAPAEVLACLADKGLFQLH